MLCKLDALGIWIYVCCVSYITFFLSFFHFISDFVAIFGWMLMLFCLYRSYVVYSLLTSRFIFFKGYYKLFRGKYILFPFFQIQVWQISLSCYFCFNSHVIRLFVLFRFLVFSLSVFLFAAFCWLGQWFYISFHNAKIKKNSRKATTDIFDLALDGTLNAAGGWKDIAHFYFSKNSKQTQPILSARFFVLLYFFAVFVHCFFYVYT